MLFNFRVPRSRSWSNYLKKLYASLKKNESTAHIASFIESGNGLRDQLIPILEDCAKAKHARPEDVIKILEQYLPILEQISEGLTENVIDIGKKGTVLDIVWTSTIALDVNVKSLVHDIRWEKINCYHLLALSKYHLAVKKHRENRHEAASAASKIEKPSWDPIYESPPESKEPDILDDKDKIKEITGLLKQASAIWQFVADNLFPVTVHKQYASIPECFRDTFACLSGVAAANAQEFAVQLAVQSGKSAKITSRLAQGVSDKFMSMDKLLKSLSTDLYSMIAPDFRHYISKRSVLYRAIALKYFGKVVLAQKKYGECLIYFSEGKRMLENLSWPREKREWTGSMQVIKASVQRQIESIETVLKPAKSDNDNIYHDVVPSSLDSVDTPEGLFMIKIEAYSGYADL